MYSGTKKMVFRWKRVWVGVIFITLAAAYSMLPFTVEASTGPLQPITSTTGGIAQQLVQTSVPGSPPDLTIGNNRATWANYSDFRDRILSVTSAISNVGTTDAINVQVTGSSTTASVQLVSPLPAPVGNVLAGANSDAVLKYQIPPGVSSFNRSVQAGAYDAGGNYHTYPTNAPKLGDKIGISVGDNLASLSNAQLESALTDMAGLGVKWIRFDMAWDLVQPNDASHFDWSRYDRVVAAARSHNLNLLPILAYTPGWARPSSCSQDFQCAPADPAAFAAFARAAAVRYAPLGIRNWEIWNEPNINAFWLPAPDAAAYTRLLQASYTGIKSADPQATVITGGLSPAENTAGHIAPRDFLVQMYQSGAKGYFDAVGYHPYSFPALPENILSWSGWSQMSDLSTSIRSIMVDQGDSNKHIWATEFGVPSGGMSGVSEALQSLSYRSAIQQMSNKPWLETLFFHTYRDISSDPSTIESFFGMRRFDGTAKPSYSELAGLLK